MEKTSDVRHEIQHTRQQVATTAAEIGSRIHEKVDAVKQKLDLADFVRAHPWPALVLALGLGAAIAASGSDRKAAAATARVAKRAPRAAVRAVKATATGAAHAAGSAVSRIRGDHDEHGADHGSDGGMLVRIRERLAGQARELGEHLGRAADDIIRLSDRSRRVVDAEVPLP